MTTPDNLTVVTDDIIPAVDVLNGSGDEKVLNGTINSQVIYNLPLHTFFIRNVIQCCNEIPLNAFVSWYS